MPPEPISYNSLTRYILGHRQSFSVQPGSVLKRIWQKRCAVARAAGQRIYSGHVGREMTISPLPLSFRGRHGGKGPAAVSNQELWRAGKLATQHNSRRCLPTCIWSEKGSYVLQRFPAVILKQEFATCMSLCGAQRCLLTARGGCFSRTSLANKRAVVMFLCSREIKTAFSPPLGHI